MTTDEAERIITAYYSDDHDGMLSDLKLYAEQGFTKQFNPSQPNYLIANGIMRRLEGLLLF